MADERKRTRWLAGVMALVMLAVVYVLSYAPFLRYYFGPDDPSGNITILDTNPRGIYGAVEWLIDETPADKFYMWWARVWGVENIAYGGRTFRYLNGWNAAPP